MYTELETEIILLESEAQPTYLIQKKYVCIESGLLWQQVTANQLFCTLQLKVLEVEEVDESDTDSGQNFYLLRMKTPNAYYVIIISQY